MRGYIMGRMYKLGEHVHLIYRKNKILLNIGSSAIPLANAHGSENFGSF